MAFCHILLWGLFKARLNVNGSIMVQLLLWDSMTWWRLAYLRFGLYNLPNREDGLVEVLGDWVFLKNCFEETLEGGEGWKDCTEAWGACTKHYSALK